LNDWNHSAHLQPQTYLSEKKQQTFSLGFYFGDGTTLVVINLSDEDGLLHPGRKDDAIPFQDYPKPKIQSDVEYWSPEG